MKQSILRYIDRDIDWRSMSALPLLLSSQRVAKPQQADCQNVALTMPNISMAVRRNLLAGVVPLFSEACLWGCGGWGEGGLLEGDGAWGVLGAEGALSLACGGSSFSLISSIWGFSFFRSPLPLRKQHAGQQRTIFIHMKGWEDWRSTRGWKTWQYYTMWRQTWNEKKGLKTLNKHINYIFAIKKLWYIKTVSTSRFSLRTWTLPSYFMPARSSTVCHAIFNFNYFPST